MNAIEIKGITKVYKDFQIENLNLNIPEGAIVGLVGENGAGKSTTIKLIMNAINRESGEIIVLGLDNSKEEFNSLKNDIGVVLDEAYFPEVLTAKDVERVMRHTYGNWDSNIFNDYLIKFNLPNDKKFKDFSRGMKMKLAISVALSHEARLLVLDEATSGLDPMIRDEILNVFSEFTRKEDNTVLLSSHIVSDLEKICDYIAFIHQGKLIFMEEKDELLNKYGIINISDDSLSDIPEDGIISRRKLKYSTEVLVLKEKISHVFETEHVTLEDIILFLAKEDM